MNIKPRVRILKDLWRSQEPRVKMRGMLAQREDAVQVFLLCPSGDDHKRRCTFVGAGEEHQESRAVKIINWNIQRLFLSEICIP